MERIAEWIDRGVKAVSSESESELDAIAAEVAELATGLPVPGVRP